MRRSFITTGLAILFLAVLTGCQGSMTSLFNGRPFRPLSEPVDTAAAPASQPARTHTAAKDGTASTEPAGPEDPSIARVNEAVDQFVARFPPARPGSDASKQPDNTASADRTTTAKPAARSNAKAARPSEAVAARPTNQEPPTAASEGKGPAGVASAEPAGPTVGPKANTSVNIETVASPQPPKPADPAPTTNTPQINIVDVRPAANPPPGAALSPTSANQPAHKTPAPQTSDVARMITELEETVRQHPLQMDDQFKLRLLYLATGQRDRATAPFTGVDPVQAEMMSALFKTMAGAQDALRDPSKGAGTALGAASDLQRLLSEQSPVVINKMAMVTAVNSFGDYKAVNPPVFPAGQPVHVFCYCEIANFHSEPTQDGRLRTVLAAGVEVYDPTGKIVWQQKIPQIEDVVYTPRRDFFAPLEVKLPAKLPPGEYVLKVSIEDKLGATTDQQRMTFTIGK